jgi:hypothetical protein
MVTGSGASWSDDHAEIELREPYVEFYYDGVPAAEKALVA